MSGTPALTEVDAGGAALAAVPVSIEGELTIHHADAWLATLREHAHAGATQFDLSGVSALDAAGVQLLLALQRTVAHNGHRLALLHPSAVVLDVAHVCGLDALLAAQPGNGGAAAHPH